MIKLCIKYTLFAVISGFLFSCRSDKAEQYFTLKKLYSTYQNGQISECTLNGQKVYTCIYNAYDDGSVIYNLDGEEIGYCNYAWGAVDSICNELISCEVVYRVKDNIWGQPAVDKYHFGD